MKNELTPLTDGIHKAEDLEKSILGICMLEPDAFHKIATILKPDMFHVEFNGDAFTAMQQLFDQGLRPDLMTVTCEMMKLKDRKYQFANIGYDLAIMVRDVVSSAHLVQWAYMLMELWQNRETFYIQSGYYKGETPEETRQIIGEKLLSLSMRKSSDWVDASFVASQLIEHMELMRQGGVTGIRLGLDFFDRVTHGGAKGSQLIVIGARPGIGKSAIINLWATQAAKQGKTVGIINLEMKDINSFARMVSMESDVVYSRIINGIAIADQERDHVLQHLTHMASLPIFFSSSTDVNISDIRAKAYQLKKRSNLGILFIDYLQLIEGTKGKNLNREQQVAQMSRGCKLISRELDIPVILLAQLNRESAKTADHRPQITQLRESGAIEQDADIVMLLHRDIDEDGEVEQGTENDAYIKVAKHRDGKTTPWIKVGYDGPRMKFYNAGEIQFNGPVQIESAKVVRPTMQPPLIQPFANEQGDDLPF